MRSIIVKAVLSSILLSSPAFAFPRPQVGDNVDPSGTSGSNSTDTSAVDSPLDDGQNVDPGDSSASTTSFNPAATTGNDPASTGVDSAQNAGLVDGHVIATPLTVDTPSSDPPPQANKTLGGTGSNLGRPGELTGTLLGMPNCSGIFYNPKWDKCDEATGKVTTKIEPKEKRRDSPSKPQKLSAFSRESKSKRQATENPNNNPEHERDPTILSGVAGVDDGATPGITSPPEGFTDNTPRAVNNWNVPFGDTDSSEISASGSSSGGTKLNGVAPRTGNDLPGISPSIANRGKRKAQDTSPGNNNFWNTPLELPQEQEQGQVQSGGKARRQEKSPGNTNFWNVPFELPQEQSGEQAQNPGKDRRQSSGTTDLRLQSGPLSGEDRDLDGAIPYMQVGAPKTRRRWDDSPHVEVGPPGPGGARNIIINKRQNITTGSKSSASGNNNEDPTGYLGELDRSGSGLNFEDPSRDPATPPRSPGLLSERAQPDFSYVRPMHPGTNAGSRGADIPRVAVASKRQYSNSSSNANAPSNSQSGFLGELGASEVAAARANADAIPPHP